MPKLDEQITTLQERLVQLKLRQQRLDARRRALDVARERKLELRRRVLVGGIVLERLRIGAGNGADAGMGEGGGDAGQVRAWIDQALSRAADRALFGLPPREEGS